MKVITEKSLLEMANNLIESSRIEEAALIRRLIDEELEEIDTLTVPRTIRSTKKEAAALKETRVRKLRRF